MNTTKLHSTLSVIGSTLFSFGVINFYFFLLLDFWWATHGSKVADPVHGFVILHRVKGFIAFFSAFQDTAIRLLPYITLPISLIGYLIAPKKWDIAPNGRIAKYPSLVIDDPLRLWRWGAPLGGMMWLLVDFIIGPPLVTWLNGFGF